MSTYEIPASGSFAPRDFLAFVRENAGRVGRELLEKALTGFYAASDSDTPAWARMRVWGALVYLGVPLDAVPDAIPVVGFADDLAAIGVALAAIAASIKPAHTERARAIADKLLKQR